MKRVIFSIYTDQVQDHRSAPSWKRDQLRKYAQQLENAHREYAEKCNAEYFLFPTESVDYDDIQFEKILKLEALAEEYDEVLYLDFDVVPQTDTVFFDHFDMNTLCFTVMDTFFEDPDFLKLLIKKDLFDHMSMYVKYAAKASMLSLVDDFGDQGIINTGVVGGGSAIIKQLRFGERLQEMKDLLDQARRDTVFPDNIKKHWRYNNEVFFTFLVDHDEIEHTDIGLMWNYFATEKDQPISANARLVHYSNKEFHKSFS